MVKYQPPKNILIKSDGSKVEFDRIIPKNSVQKEDMFVYTYTKSATKKGQEVAWTQEYIELQLKNYFEIEKAKVKKAK